MIPLRERLAKLRSVMTANAIDAIIIPSTDPHQSEYPADHWKAREWISGFTGSSGTIVVTIDEAGLWTDSRYFLQAANELSKTDIELYKLETEGVPSIQEWLLERLMPGDALSVNGFTASVDLVRSLVKKFRPLGINVDTKLSLVYDIWEQRPKIPETAIYEVSESLAGYSRSQKIEMIRNHMRETGATHCIITALDEVAWALNLRGADAEYNPVFYSFLIVSWNNVSLYVNPHKITSAIGKKLSADDVGIFLYDDILKWLNDIAEDAAIIIDPTKTNADIYANLPKDVKKIETITPVAVLKARKNDSEIIGVKDAMLKDGVALVKYFAWLDANVCEGKVTELSGADKLSKFRKEGSDFVGESFETISAYGSNGAVVHYRSTRATNKTIGFDAFYLIDSGGQYLGGTTDVTRTLHFGNPSVKEIRDYTLVLKGHISLASAVFPLGTRGVQLDILARKALWREGLNYGHGTGHGVGCFLNVHEGPQNIRTNDNGVVLQLGMLTSNEPGVYREGEYGIRLENLVLIEPELTNEFGQFLKFSTLTLAPFSVKCIDKKLLNSDEIEWLNSYHQCVLESLSPFLNEDDKNWLVINTQPI